MLWTESIVATLKRHEVRLITYLPDTVIGMWFHMYLILDL